MEKKAKLYNEINDKISEVNFNLLWEGFKSFDFALYDSENVYYNNQILKWDNRFIGNTAIKFYDKYIAIWNIESSKILDIDILTTKIIHEMFHAFQNENNEKRFPHVFSGLNYHYNSENLSIKHKENNILIKLFNDFDETLFNEMLILRKYREKHFYKEFIYEMQLEVIEGMAEYIELKALKKLNLNKYKLATDKIKAKLASRNNLIPIREISYNIGALLLLICKDNNIPINHEIGKTEKTVFALLSENIEYKDVNIDKDEKIKVRIDEFYQKYQKTIDDFINNKPLKVNGEYQLAGLDPMNTVKIGNYLYCKHFIAYEDKGVKFIQKEAVVKIDTDFKILKIYY